MRMTSEKRAIDKVFRRRDRYDIPDWQREEVWGRDRKQSLIDSILRGWKLPKFYFVKASGDNYLVEDGQQRLAAIWEFFSDDLPLSADSASEFGGRFYRDLPRKVADTFDDFEIEFDVIEDATDEELKEFFQRLQQGMPLTSSLTCKLVDTGRSRGIESQFRKFFETFIGELAEQVEMGQAATDSDYVTFQRSVNANVTGAARTRQEIMLRKLFRIAPELADVFDPSVIAQSGVPGHISAVGDSIVQLTDQLNSKYAAKTGEDLFKPTNKTSQALLRIRKPVRDLNDYKVFVDDLYFLFRESVGTRLNGNWPSSFSHVNDLRTDLRHDVDHGDAAKVRAKRRRAGTTFKLYAGAGTPNTIEPVKFALVQSNILGAIEGDLRVLLLKP